MLIHTKKLKAEDTKGERIQVRSQDGQKKIFGWDYELGELANHESVACYIVDGPVKLYRCTARGFIFETVEF